MPVIITSTGHSVPELKLSVKNLLDSVITLYGPTKSGKSVFVKHIMKTLQPHIDQLLIVSRSEPTNQDYQDYAPLQVIHTNLYLDATQGGKKVTPAQGARMFLQAIWDRQEVMAATYKQANRPKILRRLYLRLRHKDRAKSESQFRRLAKTKERAIREVKIKFADEPDTCRDQLKKLTKRITQMLCLLYKKFLFPFREYLWGLSDLSEEERHALHYFDFNPRLLLIFDDCAAALKPLWKDQLFTDLFYQGRHKFLTTVMCFQDDTNLPADLRKNSLLSVFMTPQVFTANFNRVSNYYSKEDKKYAEQIAPDIYSHKFRKIVYLRDDGTGQHFYHAIAPYPAPFRFGSDALLELCQKVGRSGISVDTNNPYYKQFQVK